jgi:mono/diheme cytochrome c family protein
MWIAMAIGAVVPMAGSNLVAAEPVTFEKHVRPIFKTHCFLCHGEAGVTKGKLDLRLRRWLVRGGESGAAIAPGEPSESYLLSRISSGEMPPGDKKLSVTEIDVIRRWIAAGATTARPEPETIQGTEYLSEEDRSYWAFQPVKRPDVPRVQDSQQVHTQIDAFLLKRLREKRLTMSRLADPVVLIRRVTFDLTGLPPTPEDVRQYLEDRRPGAWGRAVQRLLASPRYGERWGRHWLDAAGYADSEGYSDDDRVRPSAFRFRDYVIRSFNADRPFDEFITQQLAGDELVPPPSRTLDPDQVEALAATGYLRMAPDGTGSGGVDAMVARNEVVADTIRIVSTSLLGLTVGCARCHDHRYDPISQADYYRMRAIFEPALDPKSWKTPDGRKLSLYTDADRDQKKVIETEAVKVDDERKKKTEFYITRTLEEELLLVSEEIRELLREAYRLASGKRSDAQKKLLKKHPSVANISAGSLYLYDRRREVRAGKLDSQRKQKEQKFLEEARKAHPGETVTLASLAKLNPKAAAELEADRKTANRLRSEKSADDLKTFTARADEIRSRIPHEGFLRALTEVPGKVPTTFVHFRGDHQQPRQKVEPAELAVVNLNAPVKLPVNDKALPTTGRRLAYARHLVSGGHPLVARVIVNRIWMHHFGRGLVSSPGDFGVLGERPTHPQLLDWLADEFVKSGWQVKRLHRLILGSRAYRQSSARTPELDRLDPDNLLLARMSIRRLESEALRDAILAISGSMNPGMYGEPVSVMEDAVGQIVLGKENLDGERKPTKEIDLEGEQFRRSLYVQVRRTRPLGVLETFDVPVMTPNCSKRSTSNVAPQSLMLMNSDFVVEYSERLAERIVAEAGPDRRSQVVRAWELAYGVQPAADVVKELTEFAGRQEAAFDKVKQKGDTTTPEKRAMASLCQALISANRFLYID